MVEIVQKAMTSAQPQINQKNGSVGLYGFDIIPDATKKLWLLEVNKCPTMDTHNEVTARLVPEFLEAFLDLVLEQKVSQMFQLVSSGGNFHSNRF
jgi:glutathione synthase/RimK-type ligase-like ATP-grasp enzyme